MRWLKPEFFTDPVVGTWPESAQVVYLGLWCAADDSGKFAWVLPTLYGSIMPFRSLKRFKWALQIVESSDKVKRYKVDGREYGCIPTFVLHQRFSTPAKSRVPPPPKEMQEEIRRKLLLNPVWDESCEKSLQRMFGIPEATETHGGNMGTILPAHGNNTDATRGPQSSRAREDQGSGIREQGSKGEEETPTRKRYKVWLEIHPMCQAVGFEKFAEILHEAPGAPVDAVLKRLRLEVQGMEWPWRDKNAAMVLRTRVKFADLDAKREREATVGYVPGDKNAPPSAEELRAKREAGWGQ